ncbi:hypothetical protein [Virgibacillus halodenitrificans]|uniref:hypothetical protein n=1 Tax=Virgibacillus halodenitrificans TaxID=1482 RepID=UPI00031D7930|nr:hypothetical protein [Virgibacillus halodenitrificans]
MDAFKTPNHNHGLNLEKKQSDILKSSRSRTYELIKKAHKLGLTEIYTDNNGRVKRKNSKSGQRYELNGGYSGL